MRKILLIVSLFLLAGCTTVDKTSIEEQEDGSFKLSSISENEWSGSFLSAKAIKEAEKFCMERGKVLEKIKLKKMNDGRFNCAESQLFFVCR